MEFIESAPAVHCHSGEHSGMVRIDGSLYLTQYEWQDYRDGISDPVYVEISTQ